MKGYCYLPYILAFFGQALPGKEDGWIKTQKGPKKYTKSRT